MTFQRIRLTAALKQLAPFMSRSTFYAGPRWNMIRELDIREGPPLTLCHTKFTRWLRQLAGDLAKDRQAKSSRLGSHAQPEPSTGDDPYRTAILALVQALAAGELSDEQFQRAVAALRVP
jgi:hypothetical protein